MKHLLLILLLANGAFYAYYHHVRLPPGEAARLQQQINADAMQLLPVDGAAPSAALASPTPAPSVELACHVWGDFAQAQADRVQQELDALAWGEQVSRVNLESGTQHWVFIAAQPSLADAQKKADQVKSLGVQDFYVVKEAGPYLHAISLGIFSSEEAASKRLAELRAQGVRSAQVGRRNEPAYVVRFNLDRINPTQHEVLTGLVARLGEGRLQTVPCAEGTAGLPAKAAGSSPSPTAAPSSPALSSPTATTTPTATPTATTTPTATPPAPVTPTAAATPPATSVAAPSPRPPAAGAAPTTVPTPKPSAP